jgi:endonuclease/exonuclease/phosphatase family metal-dependent hydrolase
MRVLTFNLLTVQQADGPSRHRVVRSLLPALDAEVVALQEAAPGQARDLLGPDFTIVDLPGGDPVYGTECLASRFPVPGSHTDVNAVAVEIAVPEPVLVVHHKATFERDLENVREQQALATAAFVDRLVENRPGLPVVLLGDFNAAPDTAGMRFLTGRQSLAGVSVHYEDAWEAVHGDAPGDTFTPRNPLVRSGEMPLERGRRIDHILVRGGARGPLLDVADCRLVFTEPVDGVWASDHFGVLADLRRPS